MASLGIFVCIPSPSQSESSAKVFDSKDEWVVLEAEGYAPSNPKTSLYLPFRIGLRGFSPLPGMDTAFFGVFRLATLRITESESTGVWESAWPLRLGLGAGWVAWNTPRDMVYAYGLAHYAETPGLGSGYAWSSEWAVSWERRAAWGSFGLGLGIQSYLDEVYVWPIPLFDWWLSPQSRLVCRGDYLEARQFLNKSLALTLGLRYELDVYALNRRQALVWEEWVLEAGPNWALGNGLFFKARLAKGVFGDLSLGTPPSMAYRQDADHWSMRFMLTLGEGD